MAFINFFRDVFRLQFWMSPVKFGKTITPRGGLCLAGLMLGFVSLTDWMQSEADATFQRYGVNATFAVVAMAFAAILLFSRGAQQAATARLLGMLSLGAFMIFALVGWLISVVAGWSASITLQWVAFVLILALPLLMIVWTGLGARQIFKADLTVQRPLARGLAFGCALWISYALIPHWPMFESKNFKREAANYWELASALRSSQGNASENEVVKTRDEAEDRSAAIELAQPARLDAALSALEARTPGQSNVFVIALSGWSAQQVFARELRQSVAILDRSYGTAGRTIRLANNAADQESYPLATVQNLASVIRGVATRMDREQDVLLITMTSHGAQTGFALYNDDLVRRILHPEVLKTMLDQAGIRSRILVVSSCYSGTFVPVFADEDTAVITASASDRTSFGCSDNRHWTYFGEAFFENGLRDGGTLTSAFGVAKALVTKWETDQKLTPSDPQMHVGERLQKRLPSLIGGQPITRAAMAPFSIP